MANRPTLPPVEEAIEITIEKPKPPDPPPPPEPKPQPNRSRRRNQSPSQRRPFGACHRRPRSRRTNGVRCRRRAISRRTLPARRRVRSTTPCRSRSRPPRLRPPEPPKPKEPPPPVEQAGPQPRPPAPAVESLPPPPKEPSPPPVVPKPPPPAPAVTTVQPPPPPKSPPIVTPHPQPRPTPQIARPQGRPPAMANRDTPPSSSPFVNPADVRNRALASDNYIWQNARKLSFYIDEPVREVLHHATARHRARRPAARSRCGPVERDALDRPGHSRRRPQELALPASAGRDRRRPRNLPCAALDAPRMVLTAVVEPGGIASRARNIANYGARSRIDKASRLWGSAMRRPDEEPRDPARQTWQRCRSCDPRGVR